MLFTVLDVEYDPDADDSVMRSMVLSAMADDPEMAAFLQKLLGYGVTGEVSEEIFPVWTGSGRNTKGTLTQTLQSVLGDAFYREMTCGIIVDRNVSNMDAERGKLLGARVAVFNELKPGEKLLTNEVQLLSGGDGIPARPLYKDPMTIQPRHLCLLTTNHMPELTQVIPAIVERLLCVHFPVTFTDLEPGEEPTLYRRQRDNSLKQKLKENRPGILKWLVDGAVAWYAAKDLKRNAPAMVKEYSRRYFEEQDKLGAFLKECCVFEANAKVSTQTLLEAYNAWAGRECALNDKAFPAAVRAKGIDKGKARVDGRPVNCFFGVALARVDASGDALD